MMNAPLKIIKNRSDIGAGTRGSDLGIDALEIAAINENSDFFNRHPFLDVETHNETIYNKVQNTTAKRIHFVAAQCERLKNSIVSTLQSDFFPLILSGDHSSALGSIAGIKTYAPSKKIGVIWIDAHADIHSPYSTPSGNIHGMPLGAALGQDHLDLKINDVSKETLSDWEQMKQMGGVCPMLRPEHLVYFGVRDTEPQEEAILERLKIKNYKVHEVRHRGIDLCVQEALTRLVDVDLIYLAFDVDALDCDLISKGTGTPVSKGFDPLEVIKLLQGFLASQKVVALELCEINPLLDEKGNRMAECAFEIVNSLFSSP
ncbi:MAG: arginase [Flavobacteriaceae bacterium]